MENYIIKGAGTINEICTALKTMQAVFGKGEKLSEVARYLTVKKAVENQLEKLEKGDKTMKNIEFCAGYYEWAVFVDGELIHAFHDISEFITDDMTAETVAELVDDLIWEWQEDCREHGGYCPIDEEETNELANAMKTAICNHYGIE